MREKHKKWRILRLLKFYVVKFYKNKTLKNIFKNSKSKPPLKRPKKIFKNDILSWRIFFAHFEQYLAHFQEKNLDTLLIISPQFRLGLHGGGRLEGVLVIWGGKGEATWKGGSEDA